MSRLAFGGERNVGNLAISYLPLPRKESEANNDVFVCEMTGGANANETGVGAGLTGVDLVLTRSGTIGASIDGWRTLSTTSSSFSVTNTFLNNFLNSNDGFSLMGRVRNATTPVSANQATMHIVAYTANSTLLFHTDWDTRTGKNQIIFLNYRRTTDGFTPVEIVASLRGEVSFNVGATWAVSFDPINGLFVAAVKYGLDYPVKAEDFDVVSVAFADCSLVEPLSSVSNAYVVGHSAGYCVVHETDVFVAAKKPCFAIS